MKLIYLKIFVAMWAAALLMTACGPRYEYKYAPSSDMYGRFIHDQEFCQGEASMRTAIMRMTMPMVGGEYDYYLTICMIEKGWHKIKAFDAPIKKGD